MDYDLCVIGAGWAGFNAALSAAKLGKKVCLVESREIGGTCLNRGCIPTKALIASSKQGLPLSESQRKKDEVVLRLRSGMSHLIKTHKIDYVESRALIDSPHSVCLGSEKKITADFILLATGSQPKGLPRLEIDHEKIVSSDDCLGLSEAPRKILIVGAGAIGCEFACLFRRLGSDVSLVEMAEEVLPGFDLAVSKKLRQSLQKSGVSVRTGTPADGLDLGGFDKVLLSVGRKAKIEGLWTDDLAIKTEKEAISVDRELRTSVSNIFAAGDCIGGYMLAHVASYEGELAVNNMFSDPLKRDYLVIPSSVFSAPEVASVGITEEEAKKFGCSYAAKTVHFLSVGMAHVLGQTDGFVKVIAEVETGRILGASIVGLEAPELVNSFSLLIKNKISVSGLKHTVFAHPSVSEILGEVARAF